MFAKKGAVQTICVHKKHLLHPCFVSGCKKLKYVIANMQQEKK
jgi:hypothetical protein